MIVWLSALGCAPPPATHDCDLSGPHLVVATTDYVAGALAAVDPVTGCTADRLSSVGPDPIVRALQEGMVVADRSGGDTVRRFARSAYQTPVSEFVVEVGGNIHDLAQVDDQLLITLYDRDFAAVVGLDGAPRGTVDLSEQADADGLPEADAIVMVDGTPHLGLQRLTRPAHTADEAGWVAMVDLELQVVSGTLPLGPNPRLFASGGAELLVATGAFFAPDGEVFRVDPATGLRTSVLTEAEIGQDVTHAVAAGDVLLVVTVPHDPEGGPSQLLCVYPDGEIVLGLESVSWLRDIVVTPQGAVLATRRGWSFEGDGALYTVEPDTCGVALLTDAFLLDPDSIAWID
ncbi:MAG: hypothetical protein KTR31_12265 [Myxococcales bacterium]|nr:hypothetical protein [Myxococcales bacterium]